MNPIDMHICRDRTSSLHTLHSSCQDFACCQMADMWGKHIVNMLAVRTFSQSFIWVTSGESSSPVTDYRIKNPPNFPALPHIYILNTSWQITLQISWYFCPLFFHQPSRNGLSVRLRKKWQGCRIVTSRIRSPPPSLLPPPRTRTPGGGCMLQRQPRLSVLQHCGHFSRSRTPLQRGGSARQTAGAWAWLHAASGLTCSAVARSVAGRTEHFLGWGRDGGG